MKFRTVVALVALAVGASAQTTVPPEVQNSVLMVLATALPSDSVSYALASSSAFAEEMASSLAAGNTPSWYQALPSEVKSLLPVLYPGAAEATPTPSGSVTPSGTPAITSIIDSSSVVPTAANSSTVSVKSPTLSASGSISATASVSMPESTGGAAAFPNAAIGAGVGAVIGFLGMLAL
ncbi:Nn.00g017700.m01.CDS01 [Neocucurbitaria sp. VM-36]